MSALPDRPVLIVFSGLPGTGKTTVSKLLAEKLHAVHLRIDSIEQAMKSAGAVNTGVAGYAVANALAAANLALGHSIIADCVNPVAASRLAWREIAAQTATCLIDIHLICSDTLEHKRRVETRLADIPGLVPPSWNSVQQHAFEPRDDDYLLLDTAILQPEDLVQRCADHIAAKRRQP